MLLRAGVALEQSNQPTWRDWSKAFTAAVEGVMEIGGAHPGDRTMVDAIYPAAETFAAVVAETSRSEFPLRAAARAAKLGAGRTVSMTPRLGRSSYIGGRALGFADPGAHAVTVWLSAICDALEKTIPHGGV
jgi:triose/dihydroxyacetone kinase / FAD-AMP lyase (cyclizing)